MANRILRDWTQSEVINSITEKSEIFFTRLIMKADDFGCFYGNVKLLKAALYPLRQITDKEIISSINECVKVGLIMVYSVDGKRYVKINNFGQRLRTMKSKFPDPQQDNVFDSDSLTSDGNSPLETKRKEVETETEVEIETETEVKIDFYVFWDLYDKKIGDKDKLIEKWNKLSLETQESILAYIPKYKQSQPDKKFRKNPDTFFNQKSWNDELVGIVVRKLVKIDEDNKW